MDDNGRSFLLERMQNYFREEGATINEIKAVLRPRVDESEALGWPVCDVADRLQAIGTVRQREDFALLADLTKRVDNILTKGREMFVAAESKAADAGSFVEDKKAALELREMIGRYSGLVAEHAAEGEYQEVIDILGEFIEPVEQFFTDVLVLDPDDPGATLNRKQLLTELSGVLTRCFDIRELAGQAERRDDRG
jgi:glycyl-tRNA synthetase beta subunit